MSECVWKWDPVYGKYQTSCGHKTKSTNKAWIYCQFCGCSKQIEKIEYLNSEHIQKRHKKYRNEHKEYYSKYGKQWRNDHPDYYKKYAMGDLV